MNSVSKSITVQSEIWLFEIPFFLEGIFKDDGGDRVVRFSVRVGNKTLGEVLRYMLAMVGGPQLRLDPPWNVIESIRLDSFAFELEMRNGRSRYGLSYTDLGLDFTFAQFDKLEVFYAPRSAEAPNASLDVNVFGKFLGVDFTREPIGWDALKEQPPQTPSASKETFRLDYLGFGQRVTLRDISSLDTIGKVVTALRNSYQALAEGTINPLAKNLPALTFDESAAWLIGAKFSVLETFDFAGLWNLPKLAGARVALKGERAKSLAGFEFEILYRRIAADLGQYQLELVLPDVLRRFQAGAASVTLPIINVEIYTDGGFKIDLGFPRNLNFERSFSIEMIVWAGPVPIPITAAVGVYFGRLSALAVPNLPAIRGGSFGTVVIAGLGFRVGLGKSFRAGILEAGFFLGIEGIIEGVVGFYEPFEASEPKATYYRVTGYLQLTGHIYGKIDFAIVSAAVDIYAYISVQATFEAYRAVPITFEAGVSVSLSVKVGIGWFSFTVRLSFSATVREQFVFGSDQQTPWQLASDLGTTLRERLGPVGYRRLPGGTIVADGAYARLLDPAFDLGHAMAALARKRRPAALRGPEEAKRLELYFRPIVSLGVVNDRPGLQPDPTKGEVNLVASLVLRISREEDEARSPAETYAAEVLRWGLARVREHAWAAGAEALGETVTLSELNYLQDHLAGAEPPIPITPDDVHAFFTHWVALALLPADWSEENLPSLTAFPMIPFLTITAGGGDASPYEFDFQSEPPCSPAYQQNIRRYFEATNPMRAPQTDAEAVCATDGSDLSMASLIFLDGFKLVLKTVVADAIDTLRLLDVPADGRSLAQIAADCGMGHPAGIARIIEANLDNAKFFKPNSRLTIAADGLPLGTAATLAALALQLDKPVLKVGRAVYSQPILDPAASIAVDGARHLLTATDTEESILSRYGIALWGEVLAANPNFDWSVPAAIPDSSYPTLTLPAGSWIDLPTLQLPPDANHTLRDICEAHGVTLASLTGQRQDIPLAQEGLARLGLAVHAREGETICALARRIGSLMPHDVARGLFDDASIFAAAGTIAIPKGTHIVARGDTLQAIADARQMAPEAIVLANVDAPWKLIPRPNTSEALPMGATLALPEVASYRPLPGETFSSIAALFGLAPLDLAMHNCESMPLPALAEVVLPPIELLSTGDVPDSPTDAALPYGIAPAGLIRANQGAAAGQGKEAPLDVVQVPQCEAIDEDRLLALLADGGETSRLSLAAQGQARFILAGLRLPAPGGTAEADVPGPDEPLWPLYTLTGQQWPAPPTPSEACWVQLAWNTTPGARRLAAAAFDAVPDPVRVNLTPNDVTLIADFRAAAADPTTIQPELLARLPFPVYQQVKVEQALGAATAWSRPEPVHFVVQESADAVSTLQLHEIPAGLRRLLPAGKAALAPLLVSVTSPDPVTGQPVKRPLADIGWATRIDMQVRLAYGGDQDGGPLRTTYEALSIGAQGQADLEALRTYIEESHGEAPIDLYLLYPADPLGPVPGTLRSNVVTAEDRARVALLKSNLSTFSNPSFARGMTATAEDFAAHAAATLAQGKAFLDLLWQISVTNGGGFFLNYPVGPENSGLPAGIFESGSEATVSIVAVLRADAGPASIAPMRFHNVLVTAENLPGPAATLQVAASDRTVTAVPGSDPVVSEALQTIAVAVGIGVGDLAALNASNAALLQAGAVIEVAEKNPLTVRPGDDLLTVAQALDLPLAGLAELVAAQTGLLAIGAVMAVRPGWVGARSRVEPEQGGFQILRRKPVEPQAIASRADELGDVVYRIQTLFQLLGYALDKADTFSASNAGLPVIPQDADQDVRLLRFGLAEGEAQPWAYRRLLPLAPFAEPARFEQLPDTDPYAGLGRTAQIGLAFQDVFGNRLPRSEPPVKVPWRQLYRDPLVPLHAWPSVTLSYDVDREEDWNAPKVLIRIKFAPAGYAATIGLTADRLRQRAESDQRQFALIYYQVAGGRVDVDALTTLTGDDRAAIDSYRLARLAKDAYHFLAAMRRLEPLVVTLTDTVKLADLAEAAAVPVPDLAQHLAHQPGLLRAGAKLLVPERMTVLPNTSLEQIAAWTGGALEPGRIGQLNAGVLLTPGLFLTVDGKEVMTGQDDTLTTMAAGGKVATVARDNAAVKGLFAEGAELALGATEAVIAGGETLGTIADARAVRLEALALANADRAIFALDAPAELPLHLAIPAGTPSTAPVLEGQNLDDFVKANGASIRDVLTANGATTGLLRVGESMWFRKPDGGDEYQTPVGEADTLATVTLRFAALVGDPSLKPADVGAYARNSANRQLLRPGSLLLLPPIRFGKEIDVAHSASRAVTIDTLGVEIRVYRNDDTLIDPAFADAPEVREVRSVIPARLSSAFSLDERATLKSFARQFQKTFDNLKLGVGPEVFSSAALRAAAEGKPEIESKLIAVHWGVDGFDATVGGAPVFFAPRPLLTTPWSATKVEIRAYTPGQPLPPPGEGTPTDFAGIDLERWAAVLLNRIDRVLKPDLAVPLRLLAPGDFEKIVSAKAAIAEAVSQSVELVLEPPPGAAPDRKSAAEQLRQQLLVELGGTFSGGVVIQYDVKAQVPRGAPWTADNAPRLLCAVSPRLPTVPADKPTLTGLAQQLAASTLLVAELVQQVGNLLVPGFKVPVGKQPEVGPLDTIASVAERADVALPDLVAAVEDLDGFLRPGAEVPLSRRKTMTDFDDSLASVLERLSSNLTSKDMEERALDILLTLNGDRPGVFVEGVELRWKNRKHTTTRADSMEDVARALAADPVKLYMDNLVTAPLLAPDVRFVFLARVPPITISPSKIALFDTPGVPNKFNAVFVTTGSDEVSNVSLDLQLTAEAMEYGVHDVPAGEGYQGSEWLTFVDFDLVQSLGAIDVPLADRQFPLPPQVLSHGVKPLVEDGKVDPAGLDAIMRYDYSMKFAFDAAAQDEIFYTRWDGEDASANANDGQDDALARNLAEYQAIDAALWDDVFRLRGWNDLFPPEDQRPVVVQAVAIFAELARQVAESWGQWGYAARAGMRGERYRIRRHRHPDGRALVSVAPESRAAAEASAKAASGRRVPSARLLGRAHQRHAAPQLAATAVEAPVPIPRTRRGEFYEVVDPDLNLLAVQRCWGGISVTRNRNLVEGARTSDAFVLRMPDARAVQYLTPSFTYVQRVEAGREIGPLEERLERIFEQLFFPGTLEDLPAMQRVSVTASFARPLAVGQSAAMAEPADTTSLFAPVATTPLLPLTATGEPGEPHPGELARRLADYLTDELTRRGLSPREAWSFTVKLFARSGTGSSAAQLFEMADLRVRMSDH